MNLSTMQKQTYRQREQTCCQGEGGQGREGLGVWNQQMQTIVYRIDKQQGPTGENRELYSILCDKSKWKGL